MKIFPYVVFQNFIAFFFTLKSVIHLECIAVLL